MLPIFVFLSIVILFALWLTKGKQEAERHAKNVMEVWFNGVMGKNDPITTKPE
jgi:hypothetical protein